MCKMKDETKTKMDCLLVAMDRLTAALEKMSASVTASDPARRQ